MRRPIALAAVAALAALTFPAGASAQDRTLFVASAVEHADGTVTLPLHRGQSAGRTVWYVVLDTSGGDVADRLGVNRSQKLANARGTAAVQRGRVVDGVLRFPASVDFAPQRIVEAPAGFPPTRFQPGSVGEDGYSPLVQLPDGTILNAPQVANASGLHDKVVRIDRAARRVTLRETDGFSRGNAVRYVSTDASDPLAAALEGATLAPALDAAPFAGGDGTDSARASLAAFVNGQTGRANPERQGLNSAVADRLDPLNVLAWTPNQGRYSPLWDVHLAQWSAAAVAARRNVRQVEFAAVEDLADDGVVTGPGGAPFGPSGFIVNCPIVSQEG